ncbi:hypothetical protein ACFLQ3_01495 [Bacteroidota bacterium]
MKNVFLVLLIVGTSLLTSCTSNNKNDVSKELIGVHEVVVKEVLQANAYTYLNVTENGVDQWLAVSKIDAKEGETYYFKDFMEMKYFESKDLGRAFESVYFIEDFKSDPEGFNITDQKIMPKGHMAVEGHEGKPAIVKDNVQVDPIEGGITIAELFANKEKYNGKKILIRGKVVKTNFEIMEKNWFHIQDGTSIESKFDLTITSQEKEVELNQILTFEGTVAIDKDFGHGYFYEVILEDGILK